MDTIKSSMDIGIIDHHIMESEKPILSVHDFMKMIARHLNAEMNNTWRVKYWADGEVELTDFSIPPRQKNLPHKQRLNEAQLPDWIKQRVAVLRICPEQTTIEGVGQKVSENIYYVIE